MRVAGEEVVGVKWNSKKEVNVNVSKCGEVNCKKLRIKVETSWPRRVKKWINEQEGEVGN